MKTLKILVYFLIIINFVFLGFLFGRISSYTVYEYVKANLTEVTDGDTIETDLGKVRLLGINTPEKNRGGYEEAKDFLLNFRGKEIELVKLKEDKDQYGRLLRYVFYNRENINEEILERGLAHVYIYTEDDFSSELRKAEENAREQEIGIWKKSSDKCGKCIFLKELNYVDPGEYVLLENKCDFECGLDGWSIKDDSSSHFYVLDFSISSYGEKKIDFSGRIWNDAGDTLFLRDKEENLVLFYRY